MRALNNDWGGGGGGGGGVGGGGGGLVDFLYRVISIFMLKYCTGHDGNNDIII